MDDPSRPLRREARARGAILLALCLAALAAKAPDAWTNPQPWAEDGTVLFAQQQGRPLPPVATPHAGYLHVGPRLAAWPTAALPLAWAPRCLCVAAWLLAGASCASLLWRLRGPARFDLVAFAALFLSPTSGEVLGNLASAQWFVQLHLVAACFAPGRSSALLVLVAALTGPFSLLLFSLYCALLALTWPSPAARAALLRPWTAPGGRWRLAALGAGALIQGVCVAVTGLEASSRLTLPLLVTALGEWSQVHVLHRQLLPGWAFLVLLVGLLAGALRVARPGARLLLVLLAGLAVLEVALAAGRPGIYLGSLDGGDRYFVLLRVAFWVTAWALVEGLLPRGASRLGPAAALTCLVVWTALTPTTNLRRPPLADLGWAARVASIPPGERALVPIHPVGWTVVVVGR